jgi:molybdopterin-guanine dinucleotide biosynthesis protein A
VTATALADDVDALILAGGRGTRMGGRIKSLLSFEGSTILERQRTVLAPFVAQIVLSTADPAPFADTGLPIVIDAEPDRGPLAGIAAGLAFTRRSYLLVVAGDMPHLSPDAIAALLARRGPGVDAVVPRVRGLPEPLFALYGARCLDAARRRLDAGRLKTSGLVTDEGLTVAWLEEAALRAIDRELRCLHNVNAPADLAPDAEGVVRR